MFQYKHMLVLENPEEGGGGEVAGPGEGEHVREQWAGKLDFLLSVIG